MDKESRDELIRGHYRNQAEAHGDSRSSTMADEIVRTKEIESICIFLSEIRRKSKARRPLKVLDLGCGNGYALNVLSRRFPRHIYVGMDFTPELLKIAKKRGLKDVRFLRGDARTLGFRDNSFHVVYTERCVINILDWKEQRRALVEIHRVLKGGGYYLMLECFTDGLNNYNHARRQLGLEKIPEAQHNRYLEKETFRRAIKDMFEIVDPKKVSRRENELLQSNFLSSHYFIARVVYPALTNRPVVHNTEFVKFFSFLPPVGDYSPIQLYMLKKI